MKNIRDWAIFLGIILAGVIVIIGVGYFASKNVKDIHEEETHKEVEGGEITELSEPTHKIDTVELPTLKELAPNLDREIKFSESIPEDFRLILSNKIEEIKSRLREDVSRGGDWMDLGLSYYSANDFEGARDVWEFLVKVDPMNFVPVENLAKLYHFSLPDYPKSEAYFRKAMTLDSASVTPYLGLYDLYRYSYKTQTTAASDILREAMVKFPNEISLYVTLGGYYRDIGNLPQAKQVFLEGLDKARDAGNVDLIAEFGKELDRVQ